MAVAGVRLQHQTLQDEAAGQDAMENGLGDDDALEGQLLEAREKEHGAGRGELEPCSAAVHGEHAQGGREAEHGQRRRI